MISADPAASMLTMSPVTRVINPTCKRCLTMIGIKITIIQTPQKFIPVCEMFFNKEYTSTDSIFIPNIVKHIPLIIYNIHVCKKLCLPKTGMSSPQHPPMLSPAKERMGGYRMGPVDGHCPGTQLYYDD